MYSSSLVKVKATQSCPTLCDPMDFIILQARILEWIAILFSRGSSQPRDQTQVSHIAGRIFTVWATREAPSNSLLFVDFFSWWPLWPVWGDTFL